MGKGKVGRPSKGGERYPSGKLKPAAPPVEATRQPISGALWQRMLKDAENIFGDARFGTELTRLGAIGQLTPSEVSTGIRVAGVYGRFEYYKNLRRSAASPHYIREFIAEGAGSDTELVNFTANIEGRERDRSWMPTEREEREREATEAFKDLQNALPFEHRAQVERLCVENEHVGYQGLIRARLGLAVLKQHFAEKDERGGKKKAKKQKKRAVMPAAVAPKPPSLNPFKDAFITVQRKINPHLDDESLEFAWNTLCALKSRADFRREKSESGST